MKAHRPMFFGKRMGIDLGTAHIRIALPGRGVVIREPSVVALSPRDDQIVAVGAQAADLVGRAPESIAIVRPMREGVIDDYLIVEALLRNYMSEVAGRLALVRPQVLVAAPAGVTDVEQRAVRDAAEQAGARRPASLIANPLAAAIGAGLPVADARGSLVVDLGAGRSEAAIISMYGVVVWESARVGGDVVSDHIAEYLRRRHNLEIGRRTADDVKATIGSAVPLDEPLRMDVPGRDAGGGLPRSVAVGSNELAPAIRAALRTVIEVIRTALERTPPELTSDVIERGIVLTGGAAQLRGLDDYLRDITSVPIHIADAPEDAVALGAAEALDNLDKVRLSLIPSEGTLAAES